MSEKEDGVFHLLLQLHNEAVSLRQRCLLHTQLYGDRHRVELMRQAALVTFGLVQQMLRESIFLGIQRLLDQASSQRNKTASLEHLLQSIPHTPENASLRRSLKKELVRLRAACTDIKEWRDRVIAHLDRPTLMMEIAPLNEIFVRTVDQSVDGIVSFLRNVAEHLYADHPYVGHEMFTFQGENLDGDTLMYHLEAGLKQHPPMHFGQKPPLGSR